MCHGQGGKRDQLLAFHSVANHLSRTPIRHSEETAKINDEDSLASGGRSSDEKQNNEALGTRKAEKVEKCTGISGSGDPAASFVFSE